MWNTIEKVVSFLDGEPTVAGVLQGSRNIDQMRKDINDLLSMTISQLHDSWSSRQACFPFSEASLDRHCLETDSNRLRWFIALHNYRIVTVTLELHPDIGTASPEVLFTYHPNENRSHLKMDEVERVYNQLPKFFRSFCKQFPYMRIQLYPFMRVSKQKLFR